MLNLQISQEMLEQLQSKADDFGFASSEEFVRYVLTELLEAIGNKDTPAGSEIDSEEEQKMLRTRLQDLGYM